MHMLQFLSCKFVKHKCHNASPLSITSWMMTPWLTLNQEFERRRKESKTKPGDRRKLDQANTMLLFSKVRNTKNADSGKLQPLFLGLHFCKVCASKSVYFQKISALEKVYRFACAHFSSLLYLLLTTILLYAVITFWSGKEGEKEARREAERFWEEAGSRKNCWSYWFFGWTHVFDQGYFKKWIHPIHPKNFFQKND